MESRSTGRRQPATEQARRARLTRAGSPDATAALAQRRGTTPRSPTRSDYLAGPRAPGGTTAARHAGIAPGPTCPCPPDSGRPADAAARPRAGHYLAVPGPMREKATAHAPGVRSARADRGQRAPGGSPIRPPTRRAAATGQPDRCRPSPCTITPSDAAHNRLVRYSSGPLGEVVLPPARSAEKQHIAARRRGSWLLRSVAGGGARVWLRPDDAGISAGARHGVVRRGTPVPRLESGGGPERRPRPARSALAR